MLTSNPYRRGDGERRGGTVGFPLPGVQRARARRRTAQPCPTGEIGGIEVRGPNVFAGYWRMPEKTREEFTADGWFKTGDVGKIDGRGYVTIVGRSKDLIISGGYNVYPAEIEGYINELPGVAESAVVGVPHRRLRRGGGRGGRRRSRAPRSTRDALIARAEGEASPTSRCPSACFVVAELPRNAMGKVQKNLLREQHEALFA